MTTTQARTFRARPESMPAIVYHYWEDLVIAKREGWRSGDPQGIAGTPTEATRKLVAEEAAYYDE